MTTTHHHPLKARRVQFDLQQTPLHWIPEDPFSTHLINGIHLLLPAGELWFCRMYNQVLPLVTAPQLRAEMQGFIRQEAIHARVHSKAEAYLWAHGLETDAFRQRVEWLFHDLLSDAPFGLPLAKQPWLAKRWLITRIGIVAAIEHFTGLLGQWSLDNRSWDKADPTMADLFRWHLAEEVEHRSVAFDLYQHLCASQLGFYVSRQALMAIVFPVFIYAFAEAGRFLGKQDPDPHTRWLAHLPLWRQLLELERVGRRTENVPTFSYFVRAAARWVAPQFHPVHEGNTAQALTYLARSPAARAAVGLQAVNA